MCLRFSFQVYIRMLFINMYCKFKRLFCRTHSTMFWTDFGDNAKIESARMDGTRRMSIVSRNSEPFTNLLHPNDVVIDLNTDIVYFSDGSAGIIGAVTLSGSGGRIVVNQLQDNPQLRRSQPTTSYIRKPRSLSIRHLAEDDQDGDDNTEEAELFWTDPEFKTLTATDLVTSGRTTNGIRKFNLRSMLPRTTPYKPFAVQFVSLNGHKVGGERCHVVAVYALLLVGCAAN